MIASDILQSAIDRARHCLSAHTWEGADRVARYTTIAGDIERGEAALRSCEPKRIQEAIDELKKHEEEQNG